MSQKEAIEIFRQRGISVTSTRTYILDLLLNKRVLITPQEITKLSKGSIHRITAYRILHFFCEKGLFYKIVDKNNRAYYTLDASLVEKLTKKHCKDHIHFKCIRCSQLTCLPVPVTSFTLPDGFVTTDNNFLLIGYCPACNAGNGDT